MPQVLQRPQPVLDGGSEPLKNEWYTIARPRLGEVRDCRRRPPATRNFATHRGLQPSTIMSSRKAFHGVLHHHKRMH
jgi:hypothetical protein